MAITVEARRYFCTANLEAPYVATLMEGGQLLNQMAYYPNAESAIAAGLAWVAEHRADAETTVVVIPDP
ncbi:MAG: hypothetical protein HC889_11360 [Synechococcaceae cyanobacterium SM1_2_3]|nr:hypothetical protein [Synechococcaceae cyanobacterium SM1_2_3]